MNLFIERMWGIREMVFKKAERWFVNKAIQDDLCKFKVSLVFLIEVGQIFCFNAIRKVSVLAAVVDRCQEKSFCVHPGEVLSVFGKLEVEVASDVCDEPREAGVGCNSQDFLVFWNGVFPMVG